MGKINLKVCPKVCKQCPFRIGSAKGYLGGVHTVESTISDIGIGSLFTCHLQRVDDVKENIAKALSGEHQICRGFMLSGIKSCKLYYGHDSESKAMAKLQKEMKSSIEPNELNRVLSTFEFREHHK